MISKNKFMKIKVRIMNKYKKKTLNKMINNIMFFKSKIRIRIKNNHYSAF
jgi:hypothetical protein